VTLEANFSTLIVEVQAVVAVTANIETTLVRIVASLGIIQASVVASVTAVTAELFLL
jgi:hypothetical protein